MPKKNDLKGINGWLLFILIIFIISAVRKTLGFLLYFYRKPLLKLAATDEALKAAYDTILNQNIFITIISIASLVILAVFLCYTIYLIIKRKKKAKKIAIIALWIGFANSLFQVIVTISYIPKLISVLNIIKNYSETTLAIAQTFLYIRLGLSLAFGLAWTIIWTLYFRKSKRVKQTLIEK